MRYANALLTLLLFGLASGAAGGFVVAVVLSSWLGKKLNEIAADLVAKAPRP